MKKIELEDKIQDLELQLESKYYKGNDGKKKDDVVDLAVFEFY